MSSHKRKGMGEFNANLPTTRSIPLPALRPFGQRWQLLWRWMLLLLPAPAGPPLHHRAYRTHWANRAFQRHYRRNRRHGCDRPNRTYGRHRRYRTDWTYGRYGGYWADRRYRGCGSDWAGWR